MQNYPRVWTGVGHGDWGVLVAKCRNDVGSSRLKNATGRRDRGGLGCETQNCCQFWTDVGSSRLKRRTGTMIVKVLVAKRRTVVTFGLTLGLISVHNHGDWGKRRTVVTFGLTLGLRVCQVSTVTGIAEVLVTKRRTVMIFGLALGLRVSKTSTVTGSGGVLVAKRRTMLTFGLALGFRVPLMSTVTRGQQGPGRKTFELMFGSFSNHADPGGERGAANLWWGSCGSRNFRCGAVRIFNFAGELFGDSARPNALAVALCELHEYTKSPANPLRGSCGRKHGRCGTVRNSSELNTSRARCPQPRSRSMRQHTKMECGKLCKACSRARQGQVGSMGGRAPGSPPALPRSPRVRLQELQSGPCCGGKRLEAATAVVYGGTGFIWFCCLLRCDCGFFTILPSHMPDRQPMRPRTGASLRSTLTWARRTISSATPRSRDTASAIHSCGITMYNTRSMKHRPVQAVFYGLLHLLKAPSQ